MCLRDVLFYVAPKDRVFDVVMFAKHLLMASV